MGCGASTGQVPPRQLVLLGGGECGKTTIFKQIQLLHGSGFSDEVRSDWISAVCSSPLRSMRVMITKADELGLEIDSVNANHRRESALTRAPGQWCQRQGCTARCRADMWRSVAPRRSSPAHHGWPGQSCFPRGRPRRRRSSGHTKH